MRVAGPAERDDVVALWEATGLTRPWNDAGADFDRAVEGPSSVVLVGLDGAGVAVATVMVGHDGHRGWLYYLAVLPDRRGEGLGRLLVGEAEAWLRSAGAVKVQLMVRDTNEAAAGFYERLGYEASPVRVLARWLADGLVPDDR